MAIKKPLKRGEVVYLTPRTLGAPTATWSQPRGAVVRVAGLFVTVRLDDGPEVTTHRDNVVRRRPARRTRPPAAEPQTIPLILPAGWEQIPLIKTTPEVAS